MILVLNFCPLDPKHFNGPVMDRWKCRIDVLGELDKKLDEIKYKRKIIIVYLDEFHFYFTNDFGNLSHARIADFLKFFTTLKEKQNEFLGAMFVVLSTNKDQLIPYELLKNPKRINKIIHLDDPTYIDRIALMKNYCISLGVSLDVIDFDYISEVMEGDDLSNGIIIHLIKNAYIEAKKTNFFWTLS